MKKATVITTAFLLSLTVISASLNAQSYDRNYDPKKLSQRLSYENFRNLKLLQVAILNYGGGQEEIDKLVDQYAEASALYFQDRMEEAAALFTENQKQILALAKSISEKFKNDSEALMKQAGKDYWKSVANRALKGEKRDPRIEKFLRNAQAGVNAGNDFYVRYKDAVVADALQFVKAIYYYRKAKENIFDMYRNMDIPEEKKQQILENNKKDIEDLNNRVYKSMEKQN